MENNIFYISDQKKIKIINEINAVLIKNNLTISEGSSVLSGVLINGLVMAINDGEDPEVCFNFLRNELPKAFDMYLKGELKL